MAVAICIASGVFMEYFALITAALGEMSSRTSLKWGLTYRFSVLIPVFMDDLLRSYHNAFGFPDYGRSNRPDNEFLYEVSRNAVLVIKGESGTQRISLRRGCD